MVMKTALIAILGAVLCLDRLGPHLMISRPVVAAPVIGLVLGDVTTGLLVGAFVELLWVDRPAVGNDVPPNDSLLAIIVTGAAVLAGTHLGVVSRQLTVFSLLVLLPLSFVIQKIETYLITNNNTLSDAALEDAKAGDAAAIERKHLAGIGKTFLLLSCLFLCLPYWGRSFSALSIPIFRLRPSGRLNSYIMPFRPC